MCTACSKIINQKVNYIVLEGRATARNPTVKMVSRIDLIKKIKCANVGCICSTYRNSNRTNYCFENIIVFKFVEFEKRIAV